MRRYANGNDGLQRAMPGDCAGNVLYHGGGQEEIGCGEGGGEGLRKRRGGDTALPSEKLAAVGDAFGSGGFVGRGQWVGVEFAEELAIVGCVSGDVAGEVGGEEFGIAAPA